MIREDRARFVGIIFAVLIAICLGVIVALGYARADESVPTPADRAQYWSNIKASTLLNGLTGINCCGPADGVRVEILPDESPRDILRVRIVDMMQSKNGYPGAIVLIPRGLLVLNVWNPYSFPIAFIRKDLTPICLSGLDGG